MNSQPPPANENRALLGIASVVASCLALPWPVYLLWWYGGARIIFPTVVKEFGWLFPYSLTLAVLGLTLGGVGAVRHWKSLATLGFVLGVVAWALHWFLWQLTYPS